MYDFDEKIDRVSEHSRKWDKKVIEGHFGKVREDFIPLWIADMDFKIPETIKEPLLKAVERGVFGYTYVYDEFYDAVVSWYKDIHNVKVNREWITLSYGTVSTVHYVVQAFCRKNDCVLMNTPVYDPFERAALKQDVKCIYNTLSIRDNRYYIDFDALESQLRAYRPKLYLFCSPHNPSGRIWSRDELLKVAELCKRYGTILVTDEVHSEHIHCGSFSTILSIEDKLMDNVILLSSPNKAFNLGGLKTSFSIISDLELRSILKNQFERNSITSPNAFGIIALIASYNNSRQWLKEVTEYIWQNYKVLEEYMNKRLPAMKVMKMESSYLAWVDISKLGISSLSLTRMLALDYGVLVEDGNNFVSDGEGFIRINLGTSRENILEALRRIESCVKDMKLKRL